MSPQATEERPDFFLSLQILTERYLSWRKRRKRLKKEKLKNKNIILDWVEAFLWAVGMVLLINQYLMQAYQIPSGSMIDTLLIGDRIFVNKIIYGPELLPGFGKLPSPIHPKRNDIIIFENPSYIGRGTVFNIAQRIIYMLTFAQVDIDRDEDGEPKPHFLIKRAVGVGGDWFIIEQGNMRIRPGGMGSWYDEGDLFIPRGMNHNISRLLDDNAYPALRAYGKASAYRDLRLPVPSQVLSYDTQLARIQYPDSFAIEKARLELLRGAFPQESWYSISLARHNQGIYVPETRILPLGDNRDNSRDGRHFGPVRTSRILGKGAMIHWPGDFRIMALNFQAFGRFGAIR